MLSLNKVKKLVRHLLEPDGGRVHAGIMSVITTNSISKVVETSPYWMLSNMIVPMHICVLQNQTHPSSVLCQEPQLTMQDDASIAPANRRVGLQEVEDESIW